MFECNPQSHREPFAEVGEARCKYHGAVAPFTWFPFHGIHTPCLLSCHVFCFHVLSVTSLLSCSFLRVHLFPFVCHCNFTYIGPVHVLPFTSAHPLLLARMCASHPPFWAGWWSSATFPGSVCMCNLGVVGSLLASVLHQRRHWTRWFYGSGTPDRRTCFIVTIKNIGWSMYSVGLLRCFDAHSPFDSSLTLTRFLRPLGAAFGDNLILDVF